MAERAKLSNEKVSQLTSKSFDLLADLDDRIKQINRPKSPDERKAAITLARGMLLQMIDFIRTSQTANSPGIDRAALRELLREIKEVEAHIGKRDWKELFGIKSQKSEDRQLMYELLKYELSDFIRDLFRNFDRLVANHDSTAIWEDACTSFLEEFERRW